MGSDDELRKHPTFWGSMQWSDLSNHPSLRGRQDILNAERPREPDHECWPPVPIDARIVWSVDGEQWIGCRALGWSGRLVYVEMLDPRSRTRGVWLRAEDVKRR